VLGAARAYDLAARSIYGDVADLNFDPITGQPNPHVIKKQRNRLGTLGIVQDDDDDMLGYLDKFIPQQQQGGGVVLNKVVVILYR